MTFTKNNILFFRSKPAKTMLELNTEFRHSLKCNDLESLSDDTFTNPEMNVIADIIRFSQPLDLQGQYGIFEFQGKKFTWEIEYFDKSLVFEAASRDPLDISITTRKMYFFRQ